MPKKLFTSENQPENKGRSSGWFRKKLIDSLKRQGMTEEGFIDLLVEKAITDGGVFLSELMKRYSPQHKQTYEPTPFDFDPAWTHLQKADAIMLAMSTGAMPPDVGHTIIEGIKKMLEIEEVTELAKRLEAIEKLLAERA